MKHITIPASIAKPFLLTLDRFKDIGSLIVRLWIAKIFFDSFLSKIHDWPSTIILFKYDYHVPFIPAVTAAYMGTAAELILPILLVLGLGGRLLVLIFFIYNIICVVSFHFLWTPPGAVGLNDHLNWGLLLMMLMLYGSGRLSLDHLLHKKFGYLIYGLKKTPK